jgi:putative hydrolase of the HAD superfamily
VEFREVQLLSLVFESLGVRFPVPLEALELAIWDAASPGVAMPGVAGLLETLHALGIRTAVVSNISYSGPSLAARINRLLPGNRIEFILASSEYIVRKPDRRFFELALAKAGVAGLDAWHAGDDAFYDVDGAAGAGIFPVWYDTPIRNDVRQSPAGLRPASPHLRVKDWGELAAILEGTF